MVKGNAKTIIVVAHAWYGDLIGGSFRLASEFAEYLADCDRPVAYVCCTTDPEPTDVTKEERGKLTIWRYPLRCGRGVPALWHHVSQSGKVVRSLCQETQISAISGHSPLQSLGAFRATKDKAVSCNYTVHSPFDDELLADAVRRSGLKRNIAARVAGWIDRRNISLADRVQTDSQYTLNALVRKHGADTTKKGTVAPGWVNAEAFVPADNRAEVREELGGSWDFDGSVFFTLRRLESRMGLDTLIAAADRIRRSGKSFRVLIGGDGSLRESLREMIQQRDLGQFVYLLGRISAEDVPRCYAAADCFVLPTQALECFGLIVLEAYAAGTPVIAADVAAIPELVSQAGSEWLFPPGDDEALASRMAGLLDGNLRPTRDLRQIACAYDRTVVLPRWAELLA